MRRQEGSLGFSVLENMAIRMGIPISILLCLISRRVLITEVGIISGSSTVAIDVIWLEMHGEKALCFSETWKTIAPDIFQVM